MISRSGMLPCLHSLKFHLDSYSEVQCGVDANANEMTLKITLWYARKTNQRYRALTICMEKPVIPARIQMARVIPANFFREKGNTFWSITSFPIQPRLPKISVPFVKNLLPGSLGNIPWRNERWRIWVMNLYRYRPFMAVTDVSFLRHC